MKFYKGYAVEVLANVCTPNQVLIRVYDDYIGNDCLKVGHEYQVNKLHLEDMASDVYRIGDKIESTVGSLTGDVVGFELDTNRVICRSSKIDRYEQKRTRYAYKLSELRKQVRDAKFEPGKWYKINSTIELFAVQSVFNVNDVMLFSKDGYILYNGVPKKTDMDFLKKHHRIDNVQKINK